MNYFISILFSVMLYFAMFYCYKKCRTDYIKKLQPTDDAPSEKERQYYGDEIKSVQGLGLTLLIVVAMFSIIIGYSYFFIFYITSIYGKDLLYCNYIVAFVWISVSFVMCIPFSYTLYALYLKIKYRKNYTRFLEFDCFFRIKNFRRKEVIPPKLSVSSDDIKNAVKDEKRGIFSIILITGIVFAFIQCQFIYSYEYFDNNELSVNNCKKRNYTYEEISAIYDIDKSLAPNGKVYDDNYYVIEFSDGSFWKSKNKKPIDEQTLQIILTKSGIDSVIEKEFYDTN